jgi:hypothetical protein
MKSMFFSRPNASCIYLFSHDWELANPTNLSKASKAILVESIASNCSLRLIGFMQVAGISLVPN